MGHAPSSNGDHAGLRAVPRGRSAVTILSADERRRRAAAILAGGILALLTASAGSKTDNPAPRETPTLPGEHEDPRAPGL